MKHHHKKFLSPLLSGIFILVFIISLFVFFPKDQPFPFTGDVIDNTYFPDTKNCRDSDKGAFSEVSGFMRYYKSGYLGIGGRWHIRYDYCTEDKNHLFEYFCNDGNPDVIFIGCQKSCENGACLNFPQFTPKEKCYLKLTINEKKQNDNILFSLDNIENVYDNLDMHVRPYIPEDGSQYILEVHRNKITGYTSSIIDKYDLSTSRLIFWDDFPQDSTEEMQGGIIELDESQIETIIPYSQDITRIVINNDNERTQLSFNPQSLNCQRTCKLPGESGIYHEEKCCQDLFPIQVNSTSFICSWCGDSICEKYENNIICPEDC